MLEFKSVKTEDRELINEYLKKVKEPFCDFTFGNLFSWSVVENTEFCFFDNFLFIRFSDDEYFYYTFPIGEDGDIKNAIFEIQEDAKNNNRELKFVCLNKNEAEFLKTIFNEKIKIYKNRDSFDYLYSVEKLKKLSGRKYHSKKNHFNSFVRKYKFNYEEINEENIEKCKKFAQKWYEENEQTEALKKEKKVLEKALNNYFLLNFEGGVLTVAGEVVAFCVGEETVFQDVFCTHFEKADLSVTAAYTAINKLFSENTISEYKFVNREDDAGIDGLRKAKLSYNPEKLLEKYYAEF